MVRLFFLGVFEVKTTHGAASSGLKLDRRREELPILPPVVGALGSGGKWVKFSAPLVDLSSVVY